MSNSGKVVIITGGSSGIGAATAKEFAKEGALLTITGRNKENLAKVAQECKSAGAIEVLKVVADQTEERDLENIMKETIAKFGQLHVLINNAGAASLGGVEDSPISQFDVMFHLNVKSHFYLTQLAIPHLEKTKGNVINVSSVASNFYDERAILYSMAKNCLDHFTKTSALELAKKGIRVNSVNPGFVMNDFRFKLGIDSEIATAFYNSEAEKHPLGGVHVDVQEVVDSIMFLTSDKAKAVTGTCLFVDRAHVLAGQ